MSDFTNARTAVVNPRRGGHDCPRCGDGYLIDESWRGLHLRRCLICGHSPDAPARPPTAAEIAMAQAESDSLAAGSTPGLTATDKRNLAAALTELGLPAPPEWTAPRPRRRQKAAWTEPHQIGLFDCSALTVDAPRRPPRRRRRPSSIEEYQLCLLK